ncbi:MAG: hypothetical protein ACK2T7_03050 [Anaerolineales bacterium]
MKRLSLALVLISLILGLSACQSRSVSPSPLPDNIPTVATATPFPTPAASIKGEELAQRLTLFDETQPEPGEVADNRVEGLIQIHEFAEAYAAALEDNVITLDELASLLQLAANARASLYSTGQPDMIQLANTAGWLLDLAIYGDWDAAEAGIYSFQRSLPRKPSL